MGEFRDKLSSDNRGNAFVPPKGPLNNYLEKSK
jgi:hypothetical protein